MFGEEDHRCDPGFWAKSMIPARYQRLRPATRVRHPTRIMHLRNYHAEQHPATHSCPMANRSISSIQNTSPNASFSALTKGDQRSLSDPLFDTSILNYRVISPLLSTQRPTQPPWPPTRKQSSSHIDPPSQAPGSTDFPSRSAPESLDPGPGGPGLVGGENLDRGQPTKPNLSARRISFFSTACPRVPR